MRYPLSMLCLGAGYPRYTHIGGFYGSFHLFMDIAVVEIGPNSGSCTLRSTARVLRFHLQAPIFLKLLPLVVAEVAIKREFSPRRHHDSPIPNSLLLVTLLVYLLYLSLTFVL